MKFFFLFMFTFLKVKIKSYYPLFLVSIDRKRKMKYILEKRVSYFPFYKRCKTFGSLPIINKNIMQENFESLNTEGFKRDDLLEFAQRAEDKRDFSGLMGGFSIGLSTGTSGTRGIFIASKEERVKWLAALLAKASFIPFKKHRLAFFLRANNNLYETTQSSGIFDFRYFDISLEFSSLLNDLYQYAPTLLIAPPSVLRLIADDMIKRDVKFEGVTVVSVADVLENNDREHLESFFKTQIHQIYQATEGFLGATCKYGHIHINEEWIILEKDYIDKEKTKFCPIITDTMRKSQAFIRYRLDDVLYVVENCPCHMNSTALSHISGRFDDIIKGYNTPVFPDFLRAIIANQLIRPNEYTLEQVSKYDFILHTQNDLVGEEETNISREMKEYFLSISKEEISLGFKSGMELSKTGKRKRVIALNMEAIC